MRTCSSECPVGRSVTARLAARLAAHQPVGYDAPRSAPRAGTAECASWLLRIPRSTVSAYFRILRVDRVNVLVQPLRGSATAFEAALQPV